MMIFLALYSRAQLLLSSARKSPTKNSAAFLETQSNERVRCLARRQRDLSGERCVPNERHARNNNNNTKQIPDKIPTEGKNV